MRRCETPNMCAPYGGCSDDVPVDKIATWLGLFIGTGIEMGIPRKQMMNALEPKKLAAIIDVLTK
jgi:hypothetical protein